MKERGNENFATSYVILKSGVKIYTENTIEYIEERMKSEDEKIWLDIAAIVTEHVEPFDKKDIIKYGEVTH